MDNKAMRDLLIRYSTEKCTEKEKALIETWYIWYSRHKTNKLPDLSSEEMERDLQKILDNLPHDR